VLPQKKAPKFWGLLLCLIALLIHGLEAGEQIRQGGGGLLYRRQIIIRILPTRTTLRTRRLARCRAV